MDKKAICPACLNEVRIFQETGDLEYDAAVSCCNECANLFEEHRDSPYNVIVYPNKYIHENRNLEYQDFLETDYWQAVRSWIVDRDQKTCRLCGDRVSWKKYHVHHASYHHKGYEFENDLITLCEYCHELFHESAIREKNELSQA